MDSLNKQISQLNGEIKEITSKIEQLYSGLNSEQDPSSRERLEERIKKLETEKGEVYGSREKLMNKLQPEGMPTRGRRTARSYM